MTGRTWVFTSRTVSAVPVLFCLTLVRTLTGASVHHDVRLDGVKRHDRQMTHAHGASDEQGRDVEPSLLTSTGSARPVRRRRRTDDPGSLLLSLVLLIFLLYNPRFPFAYKRGSRAPHAGWLISTRKDLDTRARHEHTAEQRSSSQHPFTPSTRDLGSFPSLARL